MDKPYLSYNSAKPSRVSHMFKTAQKKNGALMREMTIVEHRLAQEKLAEVRPTPLGVEILRENIKGVDCEWIFDRTISADKKVILYLHGGSWVFGNIRTARPVGVILSEVSRLKVLVVDYRLAPEDPYPAGLEDCYSVYTHLLENGYSSSDIAIFGDSAGGNLTLGLLSLLKDRKIPLPACVACASPATDMTEESRMFKQKPDLMFTPYQGREWDVFTLYCGDNDRKSPYISPLFANMAGFPPILIHVGEDEELFLDNVAFAKAAYQQGVDIKCKIWRDMFHDFTVVGITLKESRDSIKEISDFFKQHLLV